MKLDIGLDAKTDVQFWYGYGDLNPNACAQEPKSCMSANSIIPAYLIARI